MIVPVFIPHGNDEKALAQKFRLIVPHLARSRRTQSTRLREDERSVTPSISRSSKEPPPRSRDRRKLGHNGMGTKVCKTSFPMTDCFQRTSFLSRVMSRQLNTLTECPFPFSTSIVNNPDWQRKPGLQRILGILLYCGKEDALNFFGPECL